jgi:hypothetical protein
MTDSIKYWQNALLRITKERKSLRNIDDPEIWKRIERLNWLEAYAKDCLRLAGGEP